jgi:hypothetical protein
MADLISEKEFLMLTLFVVFVTGLAVGELVLGPLLHIGCGW